MSGQVDLAALRALEAAATPGPWTSERSEVDDLHFGVMPMTRLDAPNRNLFALPSLPLVDAAFIAAARNALPALLDEVERLRRQVARVEALADEWEGERFDMGPDHRGRQVTYILERRSQYYAESVRAALGDQP